MKRSEKKGETQTMTNSPTLWSSIVISIGVLTLFGFGLALMNSIDFLHLVLAWLLASTATAFLMHWVHRLKNSQYTDAFTELNTFVENLRQTPSDQWHELRIEKKLPTGLATIASSLNALAAEQSIKTHQNQSKISYSNDQTEEQLRQPRGSEGRITNKLSESRAIIKKALVVDDNEANRKLASQFLKSIGVEVDQAASGKQALSFFKKNDYCMVLMDVEMPEMNGIETTQQIRRKETSTRTRIFGLTAHTYEDDPAFLLRTDMDDYLSKPLTDENLRKLIHKWSFETAIEPPKKRLSTDKNKNQPASTENDRQTGCVDIEKCVQLARGNQALAKDMLAMLLNSLPDELEKIKSAPQIGSLIDTVHRIHGGASYCGVPKLLESSAKLDKALHENPNTHSASMITSLEKDIQELIEWHEKNDLDDAFALSHR